MAGIGGRMAGCCRPCDKAESQTAKQDEDFRWKGKGVVIVSLQDPEAKQPGLQLQLQPPLPKFNSAYRCSIPSTVPEYCLLRPSTEKRARPIGSFNHRAREAKTK